MTMFAGGALARGWLAVAVASAKDDGRPVLSRTVSIEAYREGVRLVATDSYVLLRSWIPSVDHEFALEPDLDEPPYATAVAMDPHGRAKSFLGHVLSLAAQLHEDDPGIEIRLALGVIDEVEESARPSLEGMEAHYVVLELPDAERLKLGTYEGEFPAWRPIVYGFKAKKTEAIALDPAIVGRLAKLGKYHKGSMLGFSWSGPKSAASLELIASDPRVEGLVMPCRWDFDRNAPREDDEPEDEPDE